MTNDRPKRPGVTGRLDAEQRHTLIIPALVTTFDTRLAARDVDYKPVPFNYRALPDAPVWRVLLKFGSTGQRIVAGLDIYSDVVFGRGSGDPDSPDIDLSNLGALERGVSRRHAMLRPSANKLYVIDLSSTNGTYVNAIPVGRGMAQTLRNHDSIAFAGLSCIVEVISSPPTREGASVPESQTRTAQIDVSPTLKLGRPSVGQETVMGVKVKLPKPAQKSGDSPLPPTSLSDLEKK